jgi:hypothetical protein
MSLRFVAIRAEYTEWFVDRLPERERALTLACFAPY